MDADTVRQVIEGSRYQPLSIDWQPIIWVFGIFCLIIGGLITWLWSMGKQYIQSMVLRTDKHEEWIIENRREIHELSEKQTELITQNRTSIEFLKELVLNKKKHG